MDMTKATLDREEREKRTVMEREKESEVERQSQDLHSMPPPPSPVVRQRNVNTPTVFSDDSLVDCQAIPNHLFSPPRQHQLINREEGLTRPTYQDIIDYPSPKSVDSNNLDLFVQSPAYPSPSTPTSGQVPGSAERKILAPPDFQPMQTQKPAVNLINPSPSSNKQSERPQPERLLKSTGEENVARSDEDPPLTNIPSTWSKTVIKQNIIKTLRDWDNPSEPTPPIKASKGPWRSNAELPAGPFYPSVTVQNDAQTREMVFGKKCDIISVHLRPLVNEDKSGGDQTLKRKPDESESPEIVKKPRRTFCKECGASLRTLSDIKNHPCNPKVECEDCLPKKTTLANKNVLKEHLKLMHPHRGEKYKCSACEKSFYHKTLLALHFKSKHEVEDPEKDSTPADNSPSSREKAPSPESQPELRVEKEKESEGFSVEVESVAETTTEQIDASGSETKGGEPPDSLLEGEVDAPGSVASLSSQPEKQFRCEKCDKGFHTAVRFNNHRKNCQSGKGASQSSSVKPVARYVASQSSWGDLLQAKQRCAQCGRDNYQQETLTKHLPRCRGTLISNRGQKFQCFYCQEPRRTFDTENSMRRHVATFHSKEAVEDEWDYGSIPVKTVGLAANHLFR